MSDDGQNEPQSIADALAQADDTGEKEDATVQISKAELAAIRESATNPALTPEVLREMNRRRDGGAVEDDDPTQTFDRNSLSSLLEQHPTPATQRSEPAERPSEPAEEHSKPTEEVELSDADAYGDDDQVAERDDFDVFDELSNVDDLGDFSDADLHAVVFGDDESAFEIGEGTAEKAHPQATPAAPESQSDEIGLLDDEEFAALEELTEDDLTDDDLTDDQVIDDRLPELSTPGSVAEPPSASQPSASQPSASQPSASQPSAKPPSAKPPVSTQPPAPADLDEPVADFRSPESRILIVGALLGAVAMLVAGVLRLATADMLTFLHPALAGLMIAVGVLLLMGLLISSLQDRSH